MFNYITLLLFVFSLPISIIAQNTNLGEYPSGIGMHNTTASPNGKTQEKLSTIKLSNSVLAEFEIPDTVCINTPVNFVNNSINASSYIWNFCVADIGTTPVGTNMGNIGNQLSVPVSVDYAFDNNNYYGFVVNYQPGNLVRLDYGNSLLNTPTATSMGNFGGIIPAGSGAHGVQIIKNEGKWYAIIVGGYNPVGSTPRIIKIEFGANLNNPTPVATNWGNIGNMYQPIDLHIFKENNNWYGFTVSSENNTITRFDFGSSFDNIPTGVNLGNIGGLKYPNGIFSINDNGNWRVFIVNGGDRYRTGNDYSISRLDFGSSLLNTPTGINLGNPGGLLRFPVDITILKTCDQTIGFVINGDPRANGLVKLNFNNLLSSVPTATNIGNPGNMNFPHSMSKLFKVNENFYSFITNADNNTLTRLTFSGCNSSNLPSTTLQTPTPITYNAPGTYNINLTVDEGLLTESSICKRIVVLAPPEINPLQDAKICPGKAFESNPQITNATKYIWSPSTGLSSDEIVNPIFSPTITTIYTLTASNTACTSNDDIEIKVLSALECVTPRALFLAPDSVCVSSVVNITDASINASTYSWNFCVADLNQSPVGVNMGNMGNFTQPVFMDYAFFNNNYYGFVTNYITGKLVRLDFGNSLLNTPTVVNLGNFGGILPSGIGTEGIQVVQNEGKWYAIIVAGLTGSGIANAPRLVKIEFGANLDNPAPTAVNWGNLGNMDQPIDLHVFKENDNWYGFTVNARRQSITRFSFTNSFDNIPTGVDLGNIGSLSYPTGIHAINNNGDWKVFVVNAGDDTRMNGPFSLTRLDFGASLLNPPTGVNLGSLGNKLLHPRDLTIIQTCDQIIGFVVNGRVGSNDIVKLNFNGDASTIPTATSLGNIGGLGFPHSISKLFRINNDLYSFITNVDNNTITRLRFLGCNDPELPSSTLPTPPPVIYHTPGTYNLNLTIDEGLSTQSSFCKQIVVLPKPSVDFSFAQDICNPLSVNFKNESTTYKSIVWHFGDGQSATDVEAPIITYNSYGKYDIKLKATADGGCADSSFKEIPVELTIENVISSVDTILCQENGFQLNAIEGLSYCWSPANGLSSTNIANPVISTSIPKTTYYVNALVTSTNLITNGDFSLGNTGFISDYNYTPTDGHLEGVYAVRSDVKPWHSGMSDCKDQTNSQGNMMVVNGSATINAKVWSQTIQITPNTNYAFSTWLQSLVSSNPATLQFYINGILIGELFKASTSTCSWLQFYALWNSANSTTAEIAIVNQNTVLAGNDFALDDISFSALKMSRDSVTVTIHPNPKIDFSYSVPFCKSIQLLGNAIEEPATIDNWKWQFGDHEEQTAQALTHTYAKGGNYDVKLIVTDQNNCKDSMTQTVQLDTIKAVVNADIEVCPNDLVQLTGAGGTSYEWSPVEFLNDPSSASTDASVSTTTRFYLKIKDAIQCEDTASVLVSIRPRPNFMKPPNKEVCIDSTIQLQGNNEENYSYLWSPATNLDDANALNPIATPATSSVYQVSITEPVCSYDTTFNIKVTVNPNPTVTASSLRDLDCINPTTFLTAVSSSNNLLWAPASGVDNPYSSHTMAWADTTTLFIVKTVNEFNCAAYDSVVVKVTNLGRPVFNVPNAFTPNNDGKNDCFRIKHWGNVKINRLAIFNRWGRLVFSTKNPLDCWDGRFNGEIQPSGTFVYVIQATSFCGEIERKGTLTLIR